MGRLDTLNGALDSIDTATTTLAEQLTALADRVARDDISDADLQAAVDKAAALATKISDASTAVAGIEPTPVEVPNPPEDPNEEEPVEEPVEPPVDVPGDAEPVDGSTPIDQPNA